MNWFKRHKAIIVDRWTLIAFQLIAGTIVLYNGINDESHFAVLLDGFVSGLCFSGAAYSFIMPSILSSFGQTERALMQTQLSDAMKDAFEEFRREHPDSITHVEVMADPNRKLQ